MIDAGPIPRYVSTTISSDEEHKVFVSPDGTTQKVALNKPVYTFPEVLDWPVKTLMIGQLSRVVLTLMIHGDTPSTGATN